MKAKADIAAKIKADEEFMKKTADELKAAKEKAEAEAEAARKKAQEEAEAQAKRAA